MSTRLFFSLIAIVQIAQHTFGNVVPAKAVTEKSLNSNESLAADKVNKEEDHVTQTIAINESSKATQQENSIKSVTADSQSSDKNMPQELIDFAFNELAKQSKEFLSEIFNFVHKFVTEVYAYDGPKKDELKADILPFEVMALDFVELKDDDDNSYKIQLLNETANSLNTYYAASKERKGKFIDEILEKHDFKNFLNELNTNAKNVLKIIRENIHEKWQKLAAVERGSVEDFEKWFDDFVQKNVIFGKTEVFVLDK